MTDTARYGAFLASGFSVIVRPGAVGIQSSLIAALDSAKIQGLGV
jgi:hypothetical protein